MTPQIGDRVTIKTQRGELHGKVVGHEMRDTTRHANGTPMPHVCVKSNTGWDWVEVERIVKVDRDPSQKALEGLVATIGRKELEDRLGRMA